MILHLVHDDKVVPRMISQFEEVCPGNNVYLCIMRACDNNQLSFLRDNPNVIRSDSDEIGRIPWKHIDKICIHFLSFSKIRYYRKICILHGLSKSKVIWFIWSGDIYELLEKKGYNIYSQENSYLKIRESNNTNHRALTTSIYELITIIRSKVAEFSKILFIDKRIDYIVCNSDDEFALFSKYLNFSRCKKLLRYTYYPIEDTLGPLIDGRVSGNSIIIGHSASESDNHEYILKFIENLDFGDKIIYLPLSYGRDAEYIKIIEEKYRKLSNVVFMKEFLPLEEYHNLLMGCSTFIYGNFRSEAWGNILVALYLGGKVYVSKHSFLSKYMNKEGYKFFFTENIKDTFNLSLTEDEKNNNRRIAMKSCSHEQNKRNIESIYYL